MDFDTQRDDIEPVDGRAVRFRRANMLDAYRVLRLITVLRSTRL